ncbi:MAG TPA: gamma-glutamyltransferase [Pirellulaceae bacterium]|nr:gamma-glutamyltransferase [Pirellulaceae bacterium]
MNRRTMLRQSAAAAASFSLAGLARDEALAADPANIGRAKRGMVATVHPLATDAGVNAIKRGGNAIDAAIAAAITLGVVDQHNSGLGGGCLILIYPGMPLQGSQDSPGKPRPVVAAIHLAIDGRETAPGKATRDMFLVDGQPQPTLSQTGPLAVATPGALAAYDLALKRRGKLPLKELVIPAAEIAEAGFSLDRIYAGNIRSTRESLAKFDAGRKLLLAEDGSPLPEGTLIKQPDLARTLRSIADQGIDWFYRGEFARLVGEWMQANGGILRASDFAAYRPQYRMPVRSSYREHEILGFPPPSSGGVHVAQILNILEHFDLDGIYHRDRAEFMHLVAEAMKLAFADRAHWLGDPEFVKVPAGLADSDYAAKLAAKIDLEKATPVAGHGEPADPETRTYGKLSPLIFEKHTTHIAAADADGNWVGITQTINTSFGSKVMVPGTGVFLNNEMDDFSIFPGQPNAFGLVGSEANAIAPGKRPLSSMSPTIVIDRDGQPIMTLGAAGGPTIISQVAHAIVRLLDLHLPLAEALAMPRFHHQWSPDELRIEEGLDEKTKQGLAQRGHKLKVVPRMGVSQLIRREPLTKEFAGIHDPRVPGKAAGL